MSKNETKDPNPRPGTPFLTWYESLHPDEREKLEESMRVALESVETHNQKAEVTLKITINKGTKRQVHVIPQITVKTPRPKMDPQTLWLKEGFDFATEDPRQQKLPLQRVAKLATVSRLDSIRGDDEDSSDND